MRFIEYKYNHLCRNWLRADKFDDVFEGAVCELKDEQQYNQALAEYYSFLEGTQSVARLVTESHIANELIRMNSYISCWNESHHESMAMWRLYASSHEPKGVAIKSNVGNHSTHFAFHKADKPVAIILKVYCI